ncbi:hypothetical protein TTHERM_00068070 (macronuclear) [Tetrahymena thermophila SB210]|uniref:Uncharacterized protein n=1 Tax=Tetrahymena thermophila (strain SB210) TaxID=312017 RepID=I7M0F9_TETTS|nr:hypothetical protein TTHERM_00068070 [Tetrahymena thermophila SB210]EAR87499.2 hypothetical protein TTHERM_00068070 [Tetrahymena thermophila SB210]|eukprot:XP_001007744.2 hypothetical protein TTHERM_00068070 [Tetrahymena thermophila SB210]
MSNLSDSDSEGYSINLELNPKIQQYRGIMICNQPQRWQYSIEQVGNNPFIRNDLNQEENPLFIKQEKNLIKKFKQIRVNNKYKLRSHSTTLSERDDSTQPSGPHTIQRNESFVHQRNQNQEFNSIQNQKSEKVSSRIYENIQEDIQLKPKNYISAISYRCNSESRAANLKEKFDNYNRAIAQRNKSQIKKDLVLPKIFDNKIKNFLEEHGHHESINKNNFSNKYYPDNIFKNNSKNIQKIMNQQQVIMNNMILNKLKDNDQDQSQLAKEIESFEMLSQLNQTEICNLKSYSPAKKKKYRVKKIPEKLQRELSPQERAKQDIKKLLNNKSNLTNLYYEFMNSLKFVK